MLLGKRVASIAVSLGYNYLGFPMGHIAVRKLSVYPESNSDGIGIIDSMRSNPDKQDPFLL